MPLPVPLSAYRWVPLRNREHCDCWEIACHLGESRLSGSPERQGSLPFDSTLPSNRTFGAPLRMSKSAYRTGGTRPCVLVCS
jgi:hypothetical protein